MSNNLGIDRIIGTPTEREIVDGIKEISLSHAIMSYQTIDFGRQLQIGALYILKLIMEIFFKIIVSFLLL